MFDFIPLESYLPTYYWTLAFLILVTCIYYMHADGCQKLYTQNSGVMPSLFALFIAFFLGYRPLSALYFGDMYMYALSYYSPNSTFSSGFFNLRAEWFWELIMKTCRSYDVEVEEWYVIVDIVYIGAQTWACKKLLKENLWLAILFVFYSFSFVSFGTNGLRNGMGSSLMMLAIAFFADRTKKGYAIGILLSLFAMGSHRSVIVPIIAVFASLFYIKDIKVSLKIWIACILLSLIAGGFFQRIIFSIGYDDRMATYSKGGGGFRWDFLLYSAMPVWLIWYVYKNGIRDRTFELLGNTYILANSVWLLVMRMAYNNRVAYLSWFLYGLILAYAVVRVPIWKNQDRMAGWILLLHSSFTVVMFTIGKI